MAVSGLTCRSKILRKLYYRRRAAVSVEMKKNLINVKMACSNTSMAPLLYIQTRKTNKLHFIARVISADSAALSQYNTRHTYLPRL